MNLLIITITIVDAWYVYGGSLGQDNMKDEENFYEDTFEDMNDNGIDNPQWVMRDDAMIQLCPSLQWLILMDCFIMVQVPISPLPNESDSRRQIQE